MKAFYLYVSFFFFFFLHDKNGGSESPDRSWFRRVLLAFIILGSTPDLWLITPQRLDQTQESHSIMMNLELRFHANFRLSKAPQSSALAEEHQPKFFAEPQVQHQTLEWYPHNQSSLDSIWLRHLCSALPSGIRRLPSNLQAFETSAKISIKVLLMTLGNAFTIKQNILWRTNRPPETRSGKQELLFLQFQSF